MIKIVITFSIVLLGCLAANAQSNAPVMAAGKAGNAKTQPVVGANKPVMAATAKMPTAPNTVINADKPKPVMVTSQKKPGAPSLPKK